MAKLGEFETVELPRMRDEWVELKNEVAQRKIETKNQLDSQRKELSAFMETLHAEVRCFVDNKKTEKKQMFLDV